MELLNSIGLSIVAFLVVLGVMIFIHELGHYLMAKYLGIGVETFSLGFGPRLIGFRRGQTDYRISLLPLGGYVKMSGETYEDELTGSDEEFLSRPKLHRFAVTLAGPVMNIGLAVVLGTVTYMVGLSMPAYLTEPAQIGRVSEGSAAQEAGVLPNDVIVAIDGDATPTWREVEIRVVTSPGRNLLFSIDRQGALLRKEITPRSAGRQELGTIGAMPHIPYIIDLVAPDGPAAQAGLQPDDEILDVRASDGSMVGSQSISDFISARENQPLLFRLQRGEQVLEKTIAPVAMDGHIRIGIVFASAVRTEKFGFFGALLNSVQRNIQLTVLTFQIVGRILTGRASLRTMSGPIEIARYSGAAAALGLVPLITFMGLVSLQLGIFNLLPIPILDGGVIALLAVEGLLGRDLSMRVKERIFQAGFIFLILLMGIVIFNDLSKNLSFLQ